MEGTLLVAARSQDNSLVQIHQGYQYCFLVSVETNLFDRFAAIQFVSYMTVNDFDRSGLIC